MNLHIKNHTILKQRLTHLVDQAMKFINRGNREDPAALRVIRRTLLRLFDHHFSSEDVEYVELAVLE